VRVSDGGNVAVWHLWCGKLRRMGDVLDQCGNQLRVRRQLRQENIAQLIAETLERAGERRFHEPGGGFNVSIGRSRWDGFVTEYHVLCNRIAPDSIDALERYALSLQRAGWFAANPGSTDAVVFVEVFGDVILERAPDWLRERWSQRG
jgi:hypothetical protein